MSIGGVEKVIVNTLNGLDYSRFHVTLLIMYKTEKEKINLKKIPDKVKICYLFNNPVNGLLKKIIFYLFMFFPHILINKFLVKEKYDIVVTTKDIFAYPISVNKSHKVMWVHGGLEYLEEEKSTLLNSLKRNYKKYTYSKFNRIILLTDTVKERFCNIYGLEENCIVVQNPINHYEIANLSNDSVNDFKFNDTLNIVCSCRLSVEKGVHRLINSCSQLLKEGYDFHLLIIGDGPEKAKLRELTLKDELLNSKVTFLGFKENPYKYLRNCHLYVSPSLTEGFPLSIAEAIILGLPILSTDCNGPSEMLDRGSYGLIVENNEIGLTNGLRKILSNPELLDYYMTQSKKRKKYFLFERNIRVLEQAISGD